MTAARRIASWWNRHRSNNLASDHHSSLAISFARGGRCHG